MSIDPHNEELISLLEAARLCPRRRRGKRPHVSCLYRWTTSGCKGVVLEAIQAGGTRCTSREALARFFHRLTGITTGRESQPSTPKQRQRYISAAEAELDQSGI